MNKKGAELSINIIIVAAITLIVLVIVIVIFASRTTMFSRDVNSTQAKLCSSQGGFCILSEDCAEPLSAGILSQTYPDCVGGTVCCKTRK